MSGRNVSRIQLFKLQSSFCEHCQRNREKSALLMSKAKLQLISVRLFLLYYLRDSEGERIIWSDWNVVDFPANRSGISSSFSEI